MSGPLRGGTALTQRLARRSGRPCLVVDPRHGEAANDVREWISHQGITVLNVAGPRESQQPGIEKTTEAFFVELLCASDDDAAEPC